MEKIIDNSIYIKAKDHLVTQEEFTIITTNINGLLKTTPTPSTSEIGKYYQSENYISHTDSKKTFIDKIYQIVKSYSLKKKYDLLKKNNPAAKTVLDIGSGTGDLISYCKKGFECYGTEPNLQARELSIKKGNKVVEKIEDLPLKKYDIIMMWHVLEHVHDLDYQLSSIYEMLNENGILIIAVPNYNSYDATYYKEAWAAYDVPRHLWHFNKSAMKTVLKNQNIFVVKILPLTFDSFYVSMLSEKIKRGTSNLINSFFIGLKSNWKAKSSGEYSSLIYISKKGSKNDFKAI